LTDTNGFDELQDKLGHRFNTRALLEQALTHPSAVGGVDRADNQRLEFLGDAVIGLCVSDYLCKSFPALPEGELTKARSLVVSRRSLVRLAKQMGLQAYVRIGKGLATAGRMPDSVVGDALEAIVAAIFLDAGYEQAARFVTEKLEPAMQKAACARTDEDYKSVLQEYAQGRLGTIPRYLVEAVEGPQHHKEFAVAVVLEGIIAGRGRGRTKKGAEQEAAQKALEALPHHHDGRLWTD